VAAILDASRSGNGTATASTNPSPSQTTCRTSPGTTLQDTTPDSTHPAAAGEIEH